MLSTDDWWQEVLVRHADDDATFASHGTLSGTIPSALFDNVLENCLENARKKKLADPSIEVKIEIAIAAENTVLSITDTGSAIPGSAADELFRSPIANSRRSGYGIGLFQAFRQADELGYVLILASNRAGEVRFELRRA
ncbi:MAG: ATP-binding protein [Betaproteobacteria bacterium]|nr:ATP-binding protein [Betaproteobacteria bacterium]